MRLLLDVVKKYVIGWNYALIARFTGANMGPIWGWQDPDSPHVGPMNFAIWVSAC